VLLPTPEGPETTINGAICCDSLVGLFTIGQFPEQLQELLS